MPALREPDGKIVYVSDEDASRFTAGGYTPIGDAAAGEAQSRIAPTDNGVLGSIGATISSGLSGATLGASDWLLKGALNKGQFEQLRQDREDNPVLSGLGQTAGALAPALVTGGTATPTGYLSSLTADSVASAQAAGGVGGTVRALAAAGTEGAIQNAGAYLSDVALGDRDLTAQGMTGALGTGFAFGSGGLVAMHGIEAGTMAARRMFARYAAGGEEAAATAAAEWQTKSQAAFESFDQTADLARAKLAQAQLERQQADLARRQASVAVSEAKLGAPLVEAPTAPPGASAPATAGATATPAGDGLPAGFPRDYLASQGLGPDQMKQVHLQREAARMDLTAGSRSTVDDALAALNARNGIRSAITPEIEADLSSALSEYTAARREFDDLHAKIDPDLDAALRGISGPDVQRPTVPVGEFGEPGAGGVKSPEQLAQAAREAGAELGLGAASESPATAQIRKPARLPEGTPVEPRAQTDVGMPGGRSAPAPTTPFDFKESGLQFDPETRQYTAGEAAPNEGAADDIGRITDANGIVRTAGLREALAGATRDTEGRIAALDSETQRKVRKHFNDIAERHGLSAHNGGEHELIGIVPDDEMGGAGGWHGIGGKLTLSKSSISELDPAVASAAGAADRASGPEVYNMVLHETLHGHGPMITNHWTDSDAVTARWRLADELSTEMATRKLLADEQGVRPHLVQHGGYAGMTKSAVEVVQSVTGASARDAFDALSEAAVRFKRMSGSITPDDALKTIGDHALDILGKSGKANADRLQSEWGQLAERLDRRLAEDVPEAAVTKAAAPPSSPDSDLLAALQGTKSALDSGADLKAMGEPARAEYRTAKAAKTSAAAEHFRAKATAAKESGPVIVRKTGRREMEATLPDGSKRKLDMSERQQDDFLNEQMPSGFKSDGVVVSTHRDFSIQRGVPDLPSEIEPNAVYVAKPSQLAERRLFGNGLETSDRTAAEYVDSIDGAWKEGKRLDPLTAYIKPDGSIYIEDGNHRLQAAARTDRDVAVQFRDGTHYEPQRGVRPIDERVRGELPAGRGAESEANPHIQDVNGSDGQFDHSELRGLASADPAFTSVTPDEYAALRREFKGKLTDDEKRSILDYSTDDAYRLNRKIRAGTASGADEQQFAQIDRAIEKSAAPRPIQVYRGLESGRFLEEVKPGYRFTDPAYGSTSTDIGMAKRGARTLAVDVPKGYPAAAIPTTNGLENELLLPRGTTYEVVSRATMADGHEIIHVRVVPKAEPQTDLERLLRGTKEQLGAGKSIREVGGAPAVSERVTAKPSAPAEPPSASKQLEMEHDAAVERVLAAKTPEAKAAAKAELRAVEQKITGGSARPGAVEDVAAMAPAVTRVERAAAKLTEALGAEAPAVAQEHAKAFRSAEDAADAKSMARTARAADDHAAAKSAADAQDFLGPSKKQIAVAQAQKQRLSAEAAYQKARVAEAEASIGAKKAGQAVKEGRAKFLADNPPPAGASAQGSSPGLGTRALAGAHAIGYAAELGSDLGIPGIPRPHDIPIIGPLLSAYLKYRAFKAAAGRFTGRIPATAEAHAAALAAKTRDNVARSVDQALGLVERNGTTIRRVVTIGAIRANEALSKRAFDDGQPDAGKDATVSQQAAVRMREVAAVATNPQLIVDKVRAETRDVMDPELIQALENHLVAMFQHLHDTAPKGPPPNPYTKKEWAPPAAAALQWGQRLAVANDPNVVFEMLAHGAVTPAAADTFQAVYDKLFAEAQKRLIARAADLKNPVEYRQLIQNALLFGVPLHDSLDPENASVLSTAHLPSAQPQPQAPAGPPIPGIAAPTQITSLYQTSADRRAGGIK